jgi:hypothetical protein
MPPHTHTDARGTTHTHTYTHPRSIARGAPPEMVMVVVVVVVEEKEKEKGETSEKLWKTEIVLRTSSWRTAGMGGYTYTARIRVRTNGFILCRIDSFITLAGLFCVQKSPTRISLLQLL